MTAAAVQEQDAQAPEDSEPLIEARKVSVVFDNHEVLSDISLSIDRGQTVAIIGESGCGKTVFLKSLVGLIKPTRGLIIFDGRVLRDMNVKELTETRRRFGFVFQNAALFDSMSIFDNIAFPLRQGESLDDEEVTERVMQHLF